MTGDEHKDEPEQTPGASSEGPHGELPPFELPPGMMPPGMGQPGSPPTGAPPPGSEPSQEPGGSAADAGTVAPGDTFTRYDQESDAFHCSYGAPMPALAVWDPEREVVVRVDRNTHQVLGFSIPEFAAWHGKNADENGEFELDLPDVWPMELTDPGGSATD